MVVAVAASVGVVRGSGSQSQPSRSGIVRRSLAKCGASPRDSEGSNVSAIFAGPLAALPLTLPFRVAALFADLLPATATVAKSDFLEAISALSAVEEERFGAAARAQPGEAPCRLGEWSTYEFEYGPASALHKTTIEVRCARAATLRPVTAGMGSCARPQRWGGDVGAVAAAAAAAVEPLDMARPPRHCRPLWLSSPPPLVALRQVDGADWTIAATHDSGVRSPMPAQAHFEVMDGKCTVHLITAEPKHDERPAVAQSVSDSESVRALGVKERWRLQGRAPRQPSAMVAISRHWLPLVLGIGFAVMVRRSSPATLSQVAWPL